jgi:hypothetical protein
MTTKDKIVNCKKIYILLSNSTTSFGLSSRVNVLAMGEDATGKQYVVDKFATSKGVYDSIHAIYAAFVPFFTVLPKVVTDKSLQIIIKCENICTYLILTRQLSSTRYINYYINKIYKGFTNISPNVEIIYEPSKGCKYVMDYWRVELLNSKARKMYFDRTTTVNSEYMREIGDRANANR